MSIHQKTAELRFAVIGELLRSPLSKGELRSRIKSLSEKTWLDPRTQQATKYGYATIERWYYRARKSDSPFQELMLKKRTDDGQAKIFDESMIKFFEEQYQQHPGWSVKLHYENFEAWLGASKSMPCYSSTRRLFLKQGWVRSRAPITKEKKSFEVGFAGGLWHLDFHHARRMVLLPNGRQVVPICLAIMDDCTRLCCHIQWFIHETAEVLVHGFMQALLKRGLPRALMSDNGAAMVSAEFTQGLLRLGIQHDLTMPYSPYQNGKQEKFWRTLEGRLMALTENDKALTIDKLNHLTLIWVEQQYNFAVHSELKQSPVTKWLDSTKVIRPSPPLAELKQCFRREIIRKVRRNDATFTIDGTRFEIIPLAYRSQTKLHLHYAKWDLTNVDIVDPKTKVILTSVYPIDLKANSNRDRQIVSSLKKDMTPEPPPLLQKMLAEFNVTGVPPAYIPLVENPEVEP